MTFNMSDKMLVTLEQLESFTNASRGIDFHPVQRKEKKTWIRDVLRRFMYRTLRKKDKGVVKKYLVRLTGYSDVQMKRIISRMIVRGRDAGAPPSRHHVFTRIYTPEDIALLIRTDNAHGRMSGKATKEILRREYEVFRKQEYVRLKNISVSHLYNLRETRQYVSHAVTFTKTKSVMVPIGERRKPKPYGKPGFIRVDSVHQGDQDKEKGVYHINLVDEVTQWEVVGCVEGISERFLVPILEEALASIPFHVIGFHSDNGSEYINRTVAALLLKLHIQQTKSRARHCNDNALAESKNGGVIRKQFGYVHIPRCYAERINTFDGEYFNPYINFHRPSGYATERIDARGKIRKVYDIYETPYEHFKGLPDAETYLKEDISFDMLDRIALEKSDNEAAILMQEAKFLLFKSLRAA